MSSRDFVMMTLQLAVMLGCSVFFGQLMRRMGQPAVVGEMIGGIVIGVTVLGSVAPEFHDWLFNSSANAALVRDASIKLGMLFFLYIAGSQVDLSDLRRLGRQAGTIGVVGTVIPILAGLALVYAIPAGYWGNGIEDHYFEFALFLGMNLANSANPVLARILMDLGLMRGGVGALSMTATLVDDLVNWTLFAIILRSIAQPTATSAISDDLTVGVGLVLVLFVVLLVGGRLLGTRLLHWVRAHVSWPAGSIAVVAVLILLAASFAEGIGVHAFLGAFLLGVALGGHDDDRREVHETIEGFALSVFAPIYFVSMGMTTDFIANFDLGLVLVVVVVALVSKLGGVLLGATLAGMPIDRQAWGVAWGLNARGATGIILAGVGRSVGVIDDRIFVAIVVMALVTSLMAGPMMKWLLIGHVAHSGAARLATQPTAPRPEPVRAA